MLDKLSQYKELVEKRKACRRCMVDGTERKIFNPAETNHNVDEIGHWSKWQANLDGKVLVIGQDWGDYDGFNGKDSDTNPTNGHLMKLLGSIGIFPGKPTSEDGRNGVIFLTNSVLCLKKNKDRMRGKIRKEWVSNCGQAFLVPLIDIIQPEIIITLGTWAYTSIQEIFSLEMKSFRDAILDYGRSDFQPICLPNNTRYFPMYHCGNILVNIQKGLDRQLDLWKNISPYLSKQKCMVETIEKRE